MKINLVIFFSVKHSKPIEQHVRSVKTKILMSNCPVCLESSMSSLRKVPRKYLNRFSTDKQVIVLVSAGCDSRNVHAPYYVVQRGMISVDTFFVF